jgi:hypothetical protein
MEKRKVSCPCRELKSLSSVSQLVTHAHYADNTQEMQFVPPTEKTSVLEPDVKGDDAVVTL